MIYFFILLIGFGAGLLWPRLVAEWRSQNHADPVSSVQLRRMLRRRRPSVWRRLAAFPRCIFFAIRPKRKRGGRVLPSLVSTGRRYE